jgi:hypothetical protein
MAAAQIQGMANRASDERMAKFLMVVSGALLLAMLVKECRDLLPRQSWRDREMDRRNQSQNRDR